MCGVISPLVINLPFIHFLIPNSAISSHLEDRSRAVCHMGYDRHVIGGDSKEEEGEEKGKDEKKK